MESSLTITRTKHFSFITEKLNRIDLVYYDQFRFFFKPFWFGFRFWIILIFYLVWLFLLKNQNRPNQITVPILSYIYTPIQSFETLTHLYCFHRQRLSLPFLLPSLILLYLLLLLLLCSMVLASSLSLFCVIWCWWRDVADSSCNSFTQGRGPFKW